MRGSSIPYVIFFALTVIACDRFENEEAPARQEVFYKFYGGFNAQSGVDLISRPDGYFLLGTTNSFDTLDADASSAIYFIRTDLAGNEIASSVFFSPTNDDYEAVAIKEAANGFVLLGTELVNGTPRRMIIIETDESGNESTRFAVEDSSGLSVKADGLEISSDGSFWILGTQTPDTSPTALIFRRDASGAPISFNQSDIFNDALDHTAVALVKTDNGGTERFFTLSTSPSDIPSVGNSRRMVFTRLREDNGLAITPLELEFPGVSGDIAAVDMARVGDAFVVLGNAIETGRLALGAVSLSGVDELWTRILRNDPTSDGRVANLLFTGSALSSANGGIVITGFVEGPDIGESDVILDRTDAFGNTTAFPTSEGWPRQFGGANEDEGARVIQGQDDGYAIIGFNTLAGDNSLITLIKTNRDGELN